MKFTLRLFRRSVCDSSGCDHYRAWRTRGLLFDLCCFAARLWYSVLLVGLEAPRTPASPQPRIFFNPQPKHKKPRPEEISEEDIIKLLA